MSRARSIRLPALAQDVLLALFITVMQVQGVLDREAADPGGQPLTDLGGLGFVLLVAPGLALVVRRRWPEAVFLVAAVASVVYYALGYHDGPGWLALFVALYTLTAYGDGRRSLRVAGAGITALSVVWLVAARDIEPPEALGWVFFRIGASVMAAALGESVRSRRVIAAEAVARAELAERTREEEARARVDAERLRIAREVHDTVAHAIAIINVQAGVTAHVLDRRPERARETLQAIERTSSQALQEMRTVLGVLRDGDADRTPHPGFAQVDELAVKAREAGLDVSIESVTRPEPMPSALGSAVYRIVQESLTNVIRHAGPTRVTVTLDQREDAVEVRVVDEGGRGGNAAVGPAEPGRGILGMRERCELFGGELLAGPLPGGGYAVTARLPMTPAGAAS